MFEGRRINLKGDVGGEKGKIEGRSEIKFFD